MSDPKPRYDAAASAAGEMLADQLRLAAVMNLQVVREQQAEIDRLRRLLDAAGIEHEEQR